MVEDFEIGSSATEAELRAFLPPHLTAYLAASYGASPQALLDYAVRTVLDSEGVVCCRLAGHLRGLATFKRQAFDEGVYGMGMAEIGRLVSEGSYAEKVQVSGAILRSALGLAHAAGVAHLSCSVSVDDVAGRHALEQAGFLLMDTKVEYAWNPALISSEAKPYGYALRAVAEPDERAETVRLLTLGTTIRPFVSGDLPTLQAIARDAFTTRTLTRYTVDPALAASATADLYARWVENAASGRFGDLLLVAESEGRPVGFQMLRAEKDVSELLGATVGAMGIGAVSPDASAQGAFPALLTEILSWCRQREYRFVRGGVLVNNYRMHRSCVATGATVAACYHTFHTLVPPQQ